MNTSSPPPAAPGSGPKAVATAAGLGGAPVGIVVVILWRNVTGIPLTDVEAAAIGSFGAGILGYLWHVLTTLIDRHLHL